MRSVVKRETAELHSGERWGQKVSRVFLGCKDFQKSLEKVSLSCLDGNGC